MTTIAVVGATGQVGTVMLEILAERSFPIRELRLFATARSAGSCSGQVMPAARSCSTTSRLCGWAKKWAICAAITGPTSGTSRTNRTSTGASANSVVPSRWNSLCGFRWTKM